MYFTYLIKCLPTNQFYYGVSFRKGTHPDRLWVEYFTSSTTVHKLISTYGKDAFEFEIRKTFTDPTAAQHWEAKVLKRMKVVGNPKWINRHDNISFESKFGDDNHMRKQQSKDALIQTLNANAKQQGFESYSDLRKTINPAKNPITANKIGDWKRGKIWISNPETSQEKMIDPAHLPSYPEWIRGKLKNKKSMAGKHKGKIYINNGLTVKSIPANEIESYIEAGWIRGRIK